MIKKFKKFMEGKVTILTDSEMGVLNDILNIARDEELPVSISQYSVKGPTWENEREMVIYIDIERFSDHHHESRVGSMPKNEIVDNNRFAEIAKDIFNRLKNEGFELDNPEVSYPIFRGEDEVFGLQVDIQYERSNIDDIDKDIIISITFKIKQIPLKNN